MPETDFRLGEGMAREDNLHMPANAITRRLVIAAVAIAVSSLATSSRTWAQTQPQTMTEALGTPANQKRTSLHQEIEFKAGPQRIYEVLLDSKQFAACTGMPAEIDPKAGGAFSMFGGMIVGRNIELVPNQLIVQAWRPTHWNPGVYSVVRFELKPHGSGTIVVLDHTGFPEGDFDHLDPGWKLRYWDPLAKCLAR
jgi:activator of HSP90 ATPase